MAPHIRSHRAPCYCFPIKVSLQLSSEQSVGDVRITQLDWKRVPQARSGGCKSSVATAVLGYRHAGCLQLSHVWIADPSANGRRSAAIRDAIGGGAYRLAAPGATTCGCSTLILDSRRVESSLTLVRQNPFSPSLRFPPFFISSLPLKVGPFKYS